MATLETQVQGLINRLNTEQQTAAEAALIAAAINELSSYQTFQQALLAVAEGDLNTAVSNLELAKTQLDTSADTNVQSINAATALLSQELVKLDALPEIRSQVGNLDGKFRRKVRHEGNIIASANSTAQRRSKIVYAIYDSNGDTYALMPSYQAHDTSNNSVYLAHLYQLKPNKTHVQLDTWRTITNAFQQEVTPFAINFNTSFAIVPLAGRSSADIVYKTVYQEQNSHSLLASNSDLRVDGQPLANRIGLKEGTNVKDRYGFVTQVNRSGNVIAGFNRVLYDNTKNCILALRDDDHLVEIYHDDIVETGQSFSDNVSFQAFIDGKDIIVLPFIRTNQDTIPSVTTGADISSYSSVPDVQASYGKNYSVHFLFENGKLVPLTMSQNIKRIFGNNPSGDIQPHGAVEGHFVLRIPNGGGLIVDCEAELNNWGGIWSYPRNNNILVLAVNPYSGSAFGILEQFYYDGSNYYHGLWKGTLS